MTSKAEQILAGLGGADNVVEIEPCITRLRTEVNDGSLVDEKALKAAGAHGVVKSGERRPGRRRPGGRQPGRGHRGPDVTGSDVRARSRCWSPAPGGWCRCRRSPTRCSPPRWSAPASRSTPTPARSPWCRRSPARSSRCTRTRSSCSAPTASGVLVHLGINTVRLEGTGLRGPRRAGRHRRRRRPDGALGPGSTITGEDISTIVPVVAMDRPKGSVPGPGRERRREGRRRALHRHPVSARQRRLLLDLDGTLVDSEPMHRAAYQAFLAGPRLGGARTWRIFTGRRAEDVFAVEPGPWSGHDPHALAAEVTRTQIRGRPRPRIRCRARTALIAGGRRRAASRSPIVTSARPAWVSLAVGERAGSARPHRGGRHRRRRRRGQAATRPGSCWPASGSASPHRRAVAAEDSPAGHPRRRSPPGSARVVGVSTTWSADRAHRGRRTPRCCPTCAAWWTCWPDPRERHAHRGPGATMRMSPQLPSGGLLDLLLAAGLLLEAGDGGAADLGAAGRHLPEHLELRRGVLRVRGVQPAVGQRQPDDLVPGAADLLRAATPRGSSGRSAAKRSFTCGAISAYRLLGRSGNRWCSIWWDRLPVIKCMACEPEMLAEPSIWRRYHSPRVSPSIERFSKVSTPSGKWPHMITECVHRLRTRLAVKLAARVGRNEPVGQRQRRVHDVVLGDLVADLLQRLAVARLELRGAAALLAARGSCRARGRTPRCRTRRSRR